MPVTAGGRQIRIGERSVEIHWIDMDAASEERERYWEFLSLDEKAHSGRYRSAIDAARFIVRRGRLRELLSFYLGINPSVVVLTGNTHGKLVVTGVQFNLSKSRNWALYALTQDARIGCDVEWCDPQLSFEDLAAQFFAAEEREALGGLSGAAQRAAFFRLWTAKEAFCKACGTGLSTPLDSFAVALTAPPYFLRGGEGWALQALDAPAGFAAALVIEG